MIFANARLILPDGIQEGLEVVEVDGRILEIRSARQSSDTADLGGAYLAPGFVDVHVHGGDGRDTMEGTEEALRAICDFHATGGTTSLLLTTTTAPIMQITNVLEAIRHSVPRIAQIAGAHLEGPFIAKERRGAQRAEYIREPDAQTIETLLQFADVLKRVTLAPEVDGALGFIDKLIAAHVSVSGGHSDAWDEEVHAAIAHGMRSVTHVSNCMSTMRRRGIYRVAGMLETALAEPSINCELIADGHHVSPTLMKMFYRAKGPRGISLVTDATAGAGLTNGKHFRLGDVDCIVQGDVCVLADGSALAGSAARMIDMVRVMVQQVGVPVHEAIGMASTNPARETGLSAKGRIEPGADADFVVLSPDLKVVRTIVAGRQIWPCE